MREFFRGWRRKGGIVTLVMACVFMAGWARSVSRVDHVAYLSHDRKTYGLMSIGGGIAFYRLTTPKGLSLPIDYSSYVLKYVTDDGKPIDITPWLGHKRDRRWNFVGFHFGIGNSRSGQRLDFMVPYWSIVVPLTLLSAYLLLVKSKSMVLNGR